MLGSWIYRQRAWKGASSLSSVVHMEPGCWTAQFLLCCWNLPSLVDFSPFHSHPDCCSFIFLAGKWWDRKWCENFERHWEVQVGHSLLKDRRDEVSYLTFSALSWHAFWKPGTSPSLWHLPKTMASKLSCCGIVTESWLNCWEPLSLPCWGWWVSCTCELAPLHGWGWCDIFRTALSTQFFVESSCLTSCFRQTEWVVSDLVFVTERWAIKLFQFLNFCLPLLKQDLVLQNSEGLMKVMAEQSDTAQYSWFQLN